LKTKSPHNKITQDLTWFGNVPTSTERREEIFIENREEKYESYEKISLSQLSMMEI